MGQIYWLNRQQAALKMAESADSAPTSLIHYDLAGRYSIRAAQSDTEGKVPFVGAPLPPRVATEPWPGLAENDR
jgi:hypothetical protein